jgi:hypothetical protein
MKSEPKKGIGAFRGIPEIINPKSQGNQCQEFLNTLH